MSDTLARLLAALWQIIRVVAALGILACGTMVLSLLFVATVEGWETFREEIKQMAGRERK